MRYAHTNIVSTNWKQLANFYIQTFDCTPVPPQRKQSGAWLDKGLGIKNAHLEGIHLLLPGHGIHGPTLEIYQYQDMQEQNEHLPNQQGYGHIAFEVNDVAKTLEKVCRNGGKAHGKIAQRKIAAVGFLTFVYAKDPEGNYIELQHWQ